MVTCRTFIGSLMIAAAICLVWLPYLNGMWAGLRGVELSGVRSGSAKFGHCPFQGVEGEVIYIPGNGWSAVMSARTCSSDRTAIAMVETSDDKDRPDDILVAAYEELGFSAVIFINRDTPICVEPMHKSTNDIQIGIPSVQVGVSSARVIKSKGYAKFIPDYDFAPAMVFGIISSVFILVCGWGILCSMEEGSKKSATEPSQTGRKLETELKQTENTESKVTTSESTKISDRSNLKRRNQ